MWTTFGLGPDRGSRIKLLDVCEPVLLTATLAGGMRPSPATGRHLHLVYSIDAGGFQPAATNTYSNSAGRSIEVEFDLMGPIHLNWPGSIYLTDGDTTARYVVATTLQKCAVQRAWHPLTTLLRAGMGTIPAHHSRIRSTAQIAYESAGFSGVLDHMPIPCTGDRLIKFLPEGTPGTLISEWWG